MVHHPKERQFAAVDDGPGSVNDGPVSGNASISGGNASIHGGMSAQHHGSRTIVFFFDCKDGHRFRFADCAGREPAATAPALVEHHTALEGGTDGRGGGRADDHNGHLSRGADLGQYDG